MEDCTLRSYSHVYIIKDTRWRKEIHGGGGSSLGGIEEEGVG